MPAERVPMKHVGGQQRNRRSLTGSAGEAEDQEQIRLVDSPEPPDIEPAMDSYLNSSHEHPRDSFYVTATEEPRKIFINRPVLTEADILPKYINSNDDTPKGIGGCCSSFVGKIKCDPKRVLVTTIPILSWLPNYQWSDVSYDAIAGFIVAVMNIPQGMAYALLGNLPPVVGIYMAFFPVIIYAILGTSRHVSMGTFAVICLMSGKAALDYQNSPAGASYSIVEITTALSFAVGILQVIMGILRLGALSLLLNTELVSGFTTGAAVHVFTSQVKSLLGLSLPPRVGIFKIILTYVDVIEKIHTSNLAAVIISIVTIVILAVYSEFLRPLWMRRIRFPLPMELIAVVVGTLVSQYWTFSQVYSVEIVGTIPTGLPSPDVPDFHIVSNIIFPDGLIIAVVAYAVSVSMAKIFASKHGYSVDANQELLAQGGSNFVGSFFNCGPIAASLSRSLIQEQTGGRTQLASLFSCSLLLIVLLWIAPFFEPLPKCVLSSIIVVALKGMFLQFKDLKKAWLVSKLNAFVWLATFLSTVVLDIEYGLMVGFALSVLTLLWRSSRADLTVLGAYGDTEIYVDLSSSNQAHEINGVKILKCNGNLNFATAEQFIHSFAEILNLPTGENGKKQKREKPILAISTISKEKIADNASVHTGEIHIGIERKIDYVVLDMSNVSSIDPEAALALKALIVKCNKEEMKIILAGCSPSVLNVLRSCKVVQEVGVQNVFPTTHDAVMSTSSSHLHDKLASSEVSSQYTYGESDSEPEQPYQVFESSIKQHHLDVPSGNGKH